MEHEIDKDIPEALKGVASSKGKYYLTNKDLLPAVLEAKEKGFITDKLGKMLLLLADRYSRKSNFGGYSYRKDMVSAALVNLCQNALKFDPEKSSNPFAFYTTSIHNSFLQFMSNEKKQHYIRDTLLVDMGKDPSFGYSDSPIAKKVQESKDKVPSKKMKKIKDQIDQEKMTQEIISFD